MDPVNNQENNSTPADQVPAQPATSQNLDSQSTGINTGSQITQEPAPAAPGKPGMRLPKKWLLIGILVLVLIVSFAAIFLAPKASTQKTDTKPAKKVTISPTPFPTVSAEMQQAIDEASQATKTYDDEQAATLKEYPWIRKLPLAKPTYYVYFDLDKKVFVGRLYPRPGDNVEQMKQLIQQELKISKGIPVENYTFEWTVNPK